MKRVGLFFLPTPLQCKKYGIESLWADETEDKLGGGGWAEKRQEDQTFRGKRILLGCKRQI